MSLWSRGSGEPEELVKEDHRAVEVAARVERWRCRRGPARATCTPACRSSEPTRVAYIRAFARLVLGERSRLGGPAAGSRAASSGLAMPQSMSTTSPKRPTMTLAGLMSRCTIALRVGVLERVEHAEEELDADLDRVLREVRGVARGELVDDATRGSRPRRTSSRRSTGRARRRRRRGWARCSGARGARRCGSRRRSAPGWPDRSSRAGAA